MADIEVGTSSVEGPTVAEALASLVQRDRGAVQGSLWTVLGPDAMVDATPIAALDHTTLERVAQDLAAHLVPTVQPRRFDELVPGLTTIAAVTLPISEFGERLRNRVREQKLTTWGEVATLTVGDVLSWPKTGINSVAELLGHAIVAEVDRSRSPRAAPQPAHGDDSDPITTSVLAAIREIAAFATTSDPDASLLGAINDVQSSGDVPAPVALALSTLREVPSSAIAGRAAAAYDVDALAERLLASGTERDREILRRRALNVGPAPTLEELGKERKITRERVRQIEAKALDRLDQALTEDAFQPLVSTADALRGEVGVAAPLDSLPERLRHVAACSAPEAGNETSHVLTWMAGPFKVRDGWLVRDDLTDLVRIVRSQLREQARHGIVGIEDAIAALDRVGFRSEHGRRWLEGDPRLRVLDDVVVMWEGGVIEKAELVLRLTGSTMSTEEIHEGIAEDGSIRSLSNALAGDERFLRRGKARWGLAEWGGDEYTTTVDLIHDEVEDRGGEAALDDIVTAITTRFPDVLESTIRSFASSVQFVTVRTGVIRARRPTDPYVYQGRIDEARDCFLIGGRWALRVRVTSEHLRGSGFIIPTAFAVSLGVRPSGRVDFTAPSGPISIAWHVQTQMSSIRPLLNELGAEVDDLVFLRFLPSAEAEGRLVRQRDIAAATPDEQLLLQVGADQFSDDPLVAIGRALGVASPEHASLAELEARLRKKGDEDLIPLLPTRAETVHATIELVAQDEGQRLEKKETLTYNAETKGKDKRLEHSVLKSVAAFLNADGGVLLIGVHDTDGVVGIARDLKVLNAELDRFELYLRTLLTKHIGDATITTTVAIRFQEIDGKTVAEVRADPSPDPVYVPDHNGNLTLYVRAGNQTKSLAIDEAIRYIHRHFSGERFAREILAPASDGGVSVDAGRGLGEE